MKSIKRGLLRLQADVRIVLQHPPREVTRNGFDHVIRLAGLEEPGDDGMAEVVEAHPTIGDAYASILVQSSEHLGIYLQGSAPERVVEQVTCRDVGIENAVIVPKSLYPLMFNRLQEFTQSKDYKHAILSRLGGKARPARLPSASVHKGVSLFLH
jgi:hypothetical protein